MPIALEPDSVYDVVLSTDSGKPLEKRPTFVFRYLSSRKWKELTRLADGFETNKSGAGAIDSVFSVIRMVLVGWRNMTGPDGKEIPYNPDEIDDLVTPAEAMELMMAAERQVPGIEDKKKLGSPSHSSTGRSAKNAKERQSAKTSPQI
jgi:hypothetical protein